MSETYCDPDFAPLLSDFGLPRLYEDAAVIYGVWADFRLAFMNRAWRAFAQANGGADMLARWPLGASVRNVVPPVLQSFYNEHFSRCLEELRPWEHTYDCPSPDTERRFHMLVYPLRGREGLLLIHSLRVQQPHKGPACVPHGDYFDAHQFVRQCAFCRRVARTNSAAWDWVPQWVQKPPPNTTHGLCPQCSAYYYSSDRMNAPMPTSISTTFSVAALDKIKK